MRELLGNQRLKCACSVIQLIRLHAKVMKKASSLRPHLNIDWESPKDDHKIDNLRRRNQVNPTYHLGAIQYGTSWDVGSVVDCDEEWDEKWDQEKEGEWDEEWDEKWDQEMEVEYRGFATP